jgi:hypothetical protein
VWADNLKTGNSSILKLICGLTLHDWVSNSKSIISSISGGVSSSISVFLSIDSKTLSNKLNLDSFDMLDQSCDRGQDLLSNVPLSIDFKSLSLIKVLIWTIGHITNRQFFLFFSLSLANDIRNKVVD